MGENNDYLKDFRGWRERIVRENAFDCRPMDFADSGEWAFEDGILRHRTRGFFSLAGIRAAARFGPLDGREQLIILQPENAINGFLIRRSGGNGEVLFQGRVEPGNVDVLQLAPTVQSTEANYRRLHGGRATPMIDWFLDESRARTVFDELQSEEATRYHGKYNRNLVREVREGDEVDIPDSFRWYGLDALRHFAVASNVLNTDSRSVLSCMDWDFLAEDDRPFVAGEPGTWGALLRRSYESVDVGCQCAIADVFKWLARLRVRCALRTRVLPVPELKNWVIESGCIREREKELGFMARHYRVTALGREVRNWDQPLIDSSGAGRIVLLGQERQGVLHFFIRASHEIGFLEGVQLSASIMVPPGLGAEGCDSVESALLERLESGEGVQVLAACRQSEEGGRFYRDENDYVVAWLDPAVALPRSDGYRWLTLGQIKRMIEVPGTFSMELRGVLPLLLRWL